MASEQAFGSNPEGLQYLPNQELSLSWDQRHTLNFSLLLSEPGSWSGSISASYGSGLPWTPNDRFARRQDPLLENSERLPSTLSLDFQGERQVNFYGQALTLYVQAFNLINQDMVRTVERPHLSRHAQRRSGLHILPDRDRSLWRGVSAGQERRQPERVHSDQRPACFR